MPIARLLVALAMLEVCFVAQAQQQTPAQSPPASPQIPPSTTEDLRATYIIAAGDQVLIRAFEVEELSERPYRVDGDGYVNLPLLGRVQAAGMSVHEFEQFLIEALKKYVRQPQVSVTITQFHGEPVFFVGAFKAPGIYTLQGTRTLVEMLSSIGGLLPNASRRIKVTRRKEFGALPLPNAAESVDGKVTSAMISLASLRDNVNPAEDITLKSFDVISVERAEMVYVNGEVGRVGGLELNERDSLSVAQALVMSGGLTHDADAKNARVLRPVLNSSRRAEIPININQIMSGKTSDFRLLPNDLLFVPRTSAFKKNLGRGLLIGIPVTTTIIALILR